jgi:hypothetical protein
MFALTFQGNRIEIAKADGNKFGITNLKKLVQFALETREELLKKLADGHLGFLEFFGLLDNAQDLVAVIRSFSACLDELGNLTQEEIQELVEYVVLEYKDSLPYNIDKKVEEATFAVQWALSVFNIIALSIQAYKDGKKIFSVLNF